MDLLIKNLSKTYKNGVKAIDHLNLEIGNGMFGLLGPNGAGKSTLMRTIATLQMPDSGSILFGDIDVLKDKIALRQNLGYLPQYFGVYPKMSAEKLLDYIAHLKGVTSKKDRNILVDEVLEVTNLNDVRKKQVAKYSGGMKQRFGIAQLLLNKPKLIIVDEPTAGLDPAERHRFLNIIRELGTENTVIFSTHIVDDVKELCTDLAILNSGKILKRGKPSDVIDELKNQIWGKTIRKDELSIMESSYNIISSGYNQDNSVNIRVHSLQQPDDTFELTKPQLEDVYFVSLKHKNKIVI